MVKVSLSTTLDTNHSFLLRNILHIPQITKILLGVSKFMRDNKVFNEFHSCFCIVKDLFTKKVLLQGTLRNGLYMFHLPLHKHSAVCPPSLSAASDFSTAIADSLTKKCYVSVCNKSASLLTVNAVVKSCLSPLQLWHRRLGHPTSSIVQTILNQCNISFSKTVDSFCAACPLSKSHKLPFTSSKTTYKQPLKQVVADV
ncbi:hypothetical protein ACOSP7_018489 [Xanthoceras sorbifolium]